MSHSGEDDARTYLRIQDLTKVYATRDGPVRALDQISFRERRGEFLSNLGPSGCGKSTLLNLIAGLDLPTSGEIVIEGRSTRNLTSYEWTKLRRETIGIVFQAFHLVHGLTAEENVALPLMLRGDRGRDVGLRVNEVLDMVGMSRRRHHRPGELSGGEQQRVAIARAVAHRPRLLLADEPTGNIDSHQGAEIMALIRALAKAGEQTVLLVTHSPDAAQTADYTWAMQDGRLVARTERVPELVMP
jgi:ABC-type lipoprotein export system ATPase subunit